MNSESTYIVSLPQKIASSQLDQRITLYRLTLPSEQVGKIKDSFIPRLVRRVGENPDLEGLLRAAQMDVFSRVAPGNDGELRPKNLRLVIVPEGVSGVHNVIHVVLRQVYDRIVLPYNEEQKHAYLPVSLSSIPIPHVVTRRSYERAGMEKGEKLPTNERPRPALVASRRAHRAIQNLSDRSSRAAHPYPRVQL